jgi:hypothetical protein
VNAARLAWGASEGTPAREHGEQRRLEHLRLCLVQHAAPARPRRLRAEAEVAQGRLGQDGDGELRRRLHDQDAGDVRQHVLERDAKAPLAAGACGKHEIARPDGVGRGAGDAREHRDVEDADGDDRDDEPGAVERGQHDRREQRGEGEGEVGEAHHRLLDPAAACAGEQAQPDAEDEPDADGDEADQDRVLRADEQQRADVAPEAVGAEPVRRRGRAELVGHVEVERRMRRPQQRQRRGGEEQRDEHRADEEAAVAQRAAERRGRQRDARPGHGDPGRQQRLELRHRPPSAADRSPRRARRRRS